MIDYSANGYGQWDYPSSTRNIPMRGMRSAILYTPFVGDFDGDRKSDVVYRDEGRSVLKIGYQRNNYQITDSLTEYGQISWAIPAVGDYDGDGIDDLALLRSDSILLVDYTSDNIRGWCNDYIWKTQLAILNFQNGHVLINDFDGDGKADVCWTECTGSTVNLSIDLAYNGFGDTAVITKTLNAGNLNAGNLNADDCVIKEIRAADFDGDG